VPRPHSGAGPQWSSRRGSCTADPGRRSRSAASPTAHRHRRSAVPLEVQFLSGNPVTHVGDRPRFVCAPAVRRILRDGNRRQNAQHGDRHEQFNQSKPVLGAPADSATVDRHTLTLRRAQGERKIFNEIKPRPARAELVEARARRRSTVLAAREVATAAEHAASPLGLPCKRHAVSHLAWRAKGRNVLRQDLAAHASQQYRPVSTAHGPPSAVNPTGLRHAPGRPRRAVAGRPRRAAGKTRLRTGPTRDAAL